MPYLQLDVNDSYPAEQKKQLATRMAQLDPQNASTYQSRHTQFSARWTASIANWEKQAAPLKGAPIVVQHKAFTYLEAWLGLREIAALEPKPGVEPTTAHLSAVLETLRQTPAKIVIRAAYQSPRASEWVAERGKINAVALPGPDSGSLTDYLAGQVIGGPGAFVIESDQGRGFSVALRRKLVTEIAAAPPGQLRATAVRTASLARPAPWLP